MDLQRRRFLASAGAVTGLTAASALAGAKAATSAEAPWDQEVDVVVVGGGAAGCTAAVVATERGAKVLLLERAPILGGTTRKSGGVAWIPNNPVMRERGIADPRHECLQYLCRFSFPHRYSPNSPTLGLDEVSYRTLEAFYDNGGKMVEHLANIGAARFANFGFGSQNISPPDYADHLPENKAPHGRSLVPADAEGKPTSGAIGNGANVIQPLERWLKSKSVPILTQHRATRLIRQNDRIVGLEAQQGTRTLRVKARQGVIFATGGYSHNEELIGTYQKFLYGACALSGSGGDFVNIATEVGARLGNMQSAWRTQVVLEEALQNRLLGQGAFFLPGDSMLVVNKYGQRVVNEKRNYNDRTKVHFTYDPVSEDYPNQVLLMVFDERTRDAYGGAYPIPEPSQPAPYLVSGATIAELTQNVAGRLQRVAHHTGGAALSEDFQRKLEATIARFNGFAKAGKDEDFRRGAQAYDREWQGFFSAMRQGSSHGANTMPNRTLHPLRESGPYYAVILSAGALDTNGGPMIDQHARVLGADLKPIVGLYGAGNCIASPSREAYYGAGGTIGLAMTFGYLAAMHATEVST